jgi:hypothetical protein
MPSGNGDHSASAFKPSAEHDASVDSGINLASLPKDHLLQHPADNLIHIPAQLDHGADPTHPHVDGNQSANVKFADDGSGPSGTLPSDWPTLTALTGDPSGTHGPAARAHAPSEDAPAQPTSGNNGHHWGADPEINFASIPQNHSLEHPADNSSHIQHDDNGSPAATDGAHPGRGQGDRSEPASPKFADVGDGHSAHAPGEDTSVPSALASNGHHGNADPEINLASIATNQPPERPADNLPPTPAQPGDGPHSADPSVDVNEVPSFKFADNGNGHPGTGPDGAHPAHGQADGNQSDSFKFADGGDHPGTIPNDPPALTAPSSDSSGTHGPAAPDLAKPLDVPGTAMSAAPDQFVFADNAGHGPVADHKPDMTEIDHTVPADIQHLLDTAHETNAVSALDPNPATALQDITKVQLPHQGDFHFV